MCIHAYSVTFVVFPWWEASHRSHRYSRGRGDTKHEHQDTGIKGTTVESMCHSWKITKCIWTVKEGEILKVTLSPNKHTYRPCNKGNTLLLSYPPFQKMLPSIAQSSNLGDTLGSLLSLGSLFPTQSTNKIPNITLLFPLLSHHSLTNVFSPKHSLAALLNRPSRFHSCPFLWSNFIQQSECFS